MKISGRPSKEDYYLYIAEVVSLRATCDRLHVGAVLVSNDGRILSIGYNGAPEQEDSCDD